MLPRAGACLEQPAECTFRDIRVVLDVQNPALSRKFCERSSYPPMKVAEHSIHRWLPCQREVGRQGGPHG